MIEMNCLGSDLIPEEEKEKKKDKKKKWKKIYINSIIKQFYS